MSNDCQGEGPEFVERAEIASLREQLTEAREIIGQLIGFPFATDVLDRARAFLTKGETDA